MRPTKLDYADRYALWGDLVRGNTDRLFVPTEDRPALGSIIPLEIHIEGAGLPLAVRAKVVGWRPMSERFPQGIYVQFDAAELGKARRLLGLRLPTESTPVSRRAVRAHLELAVRFGADAEAKGGLTKNISERGMLVATSWQPDVGTTTRATIELAPGDAPLEAQAQVVWTSPRQELVAFELLGLAAPDGERLGRLLEAVSDRAAGVSRAALPVLIADDERSLVDFVGSALRRHGYEIHQAVDGDEALQLIQQLKPSLVLMDVVMPKMDGAEVCRAMRADAELADIPVIFLSALGPARLHQVADDAGATDYLTKPVSLADLLNVVGRYLAKR